MQAFDMKRKYMYNFSSYEELSYVCRTNNWDIALSKDTSVLSEKRPVIKTRSGQVELSCPITIHPMEGFDGLEDGTPSELTKRRWLRFSGSGASLIWSEAISVVPEGRTNDHQLMITEDNLDVYKELISEMKKNSDAPVIAQLTHSGRMSKNSATKTPLFITRNLEYERVRPGDKDVEPVSDEYLSSLPEKYAEAAKLAVKAGFDGVDIKACHGYLLGESLSAYNREGIYGGSYINRTRLYRECFDAVVSAVPDNIIIGARFGLSDMIKYPYGFGVTKDEIPQPDFTEPVKLLKECVEKGLGVIDMTMGSPYFNSYINRPANMGPYVFVEHPLAGVARLENAGYVVKQAIPELCLIGTGYSYLKEQAIYAAAGLLNENRADCVGFGRMAFAYEGFANDMKNGFMDKNKSCISCGKCTEIMRAGGTTGCPIRDQQIYLPIYRKLCMHKED